MLYVVATPIGNLEDITYRAVRVLGEADLIACEDTRQTRKLLDHYGIQKPTISYHEHNELDRSEELVDRLRAGVVIALVSDAGMPLVSDPGYRLVHAAIEAGIPVQPIPGPSAALAAISASGLPTDRFYFGGFLPSKPGQRQHALDDLAGEHATLIFYEAPHRILEALDAIEAVLGPRPVVVAREITKLHEEFLRGTVSEVRAQLTERERIRGEFVLLIEAPLSSAAEGSHSLSDRRETISIQLERLRIDSGLDEKEGLKRLARECGKSKSELYRELQRERARDR